MACHTLGRTAESDDALAELIESFEQDAAYNIAYVFAFRGEADAAFEWLDKAVHYNDPGLAEIANERDVATVAFVYNTGFPAFRTSALAWMFLGGLVALEARARPADGESARGGD